MDIQLNLTSSSAKTKKPLQKQKLDKKSKPDAITTSNFNFVQHPKLEGRTFARQRKPKQQNEKSTFSFLQSNKSSQEIEQKTKKNTNVSNIIKKSEDSSNRDADLSINISGNSENNTDISKSKKPYRDNSAGNKFDKKAKYEKRDNNFQKRNFKEKFQQNTSNAESTDVNSKPTFKQISALFRNNPDIPKIGQRHVKPVDEKLFSGKNFTDLNIHPFNVSNLEKNLGLKELTVVQQKSIPIILKGRDVLVRSQTGSGKTLAYALPIIEALQAIRPMIKRQDGIKALVIVPTRELALQTYELFVKLVYPFTRIVPGYLIGGENRKAEKARLRKGFNILIGTPGRISDHLKNTTSLKLNGTRCLILDEADRLLDMGYEKDVSGIVQTLDCHIAASKYNPMALMRQKVKESHIHFDNDNQSETDAHNESKNAEDKPSDTNYQHELSKVFNSDKRQTVLLSATLTKAVETLAGLTMEDPVFIDSSEDRGTLIADSIVKPVQTTGRNIEEDNEDQTSDHNDDDDLEIVPQKSDNEDSSAETSNDDSDNEDDDSSNDSTSDEESNESDEDSIKKNATVYKGIKAFIGVKESEPKEPKSSIKTKEKATPKSKSNSKTEAYNEDSNSDSDYDFFEATKSKSPLKKDTTIFTDSGSQSNPFQNAVQNAIAQDEMVIPSSVTQIYMVVPMKLRLVTLSALIVERCVNTDNGKMLVFMATQDLIDYHCEILSRILTGKTPKKFAISEPKKFKKKRKFEDTAENNEGVTDEKVNVTEPIKKETEASDDKLKALIDKEDDDYEYNYDGIPLEVYEAKMRAEKAFVDVEFFQLHGSMDQKTRTEVFKTFRNAKSGVLLCTDVAARGLDLPHVDCIVQFTGPISATDYVHRVGRTARAGNVGTAIMFLLPSEVLFVRQLEERRIRLHQEEMDETLGVLQRVGSKATFNKHRGGKQAAEQEAATALQQNYETLVEADKELHLKACKAFTSWMRFYSTYPREARGAFDRRALHAGHAACALALRKTPKQIARNAPKDKQEKPSNRLSNQNPEERREKTPKKNTEHVPADFDVRPTSAKAAKRNRMMLVSEFDSGMEPTKKKKK